ncbi:MAG: hypothetical protein HamCj_20360 [Candidatus Hamiltonella defensa (Ceratovacuna japonica)]|nr:hypothetical protein [Candidatus Hamiltonella defensa]
MTALQGMMSQFLLQKREHLETWFAQEMFQTSCELPKAPLAEVYAPSQVQTLLQQGNQLHRLIFTVRAFIFVSQNPVLTHAIA